MLLHFNALQHLCQNENLIRKANVNATKMVKSIKRKKKTHKRIANKKVIKLKKKDKNSRKAKRLSEFC